MDVLSVVVPLPAHDRQVRSTCLEIAHAARALVWDGIIENYEILLVDDNASRSVIESANVLAQRDRHVRVVHLDPQSLSDAVRDALPLATGTIVACIRNDVRSGAHLFKDAIRTLRASHAEVVALTESPDASAFALIRSGAVSKLGRFGSVAKQRRVKFVKIDEAGQEIEAPARALRVVRDRPFVAGITSVAAIAAALALIFAGATPRPGGRGATVARVAAPIPATKERVARSDPPKVVRRHGAQFTQFTVPNLPNARMPAVAAKTEPMPEPVRVFDATSDATCATDVTASLQQEIDGLPDDAALRLRLGGCYLASGVFTIHARQGLTLDGRGAEIRSGSVACQSSSRVRITDLAIATSQARRPALSFERCSRVELADLHLASAGSGLEVFSGTQDLDVRSVSIDADREAVSIEGGSRLSFEDLVTHSGYHAALRFDADDGDVVDGVDIHDSTLDSDGTAVEAFGTGALRNIAIYRNRFLGGRQKIIVSTDDSAPSTGWVIYANHGDETNGLGPYITFRNARDVAVVQNVLPAKTVPLRAAVEFGSSGGNLGVIGNDFTGACRVYTADSQTGPVKSRDNRVSNC